MNLSSRLDKIEKHLKLINTEYGERFFMIDISQGETVFNVYYHNTSKQGKTYKENIPSVEGITKAEYEEYRQKYMNGEHRCIIDDIDRWEG